MGILTSTDAFNGQTGLSFGKSGHGHIRHAFDIASDNGARKLLIVSAVPVAALEPEVNQVCPIYALTSFKDIDELDNALKNAKIDYEAIVLVGLEVLQGLALTHLVGVKQPNLQDFGASVRLVENAIFELTRLCPVVWVTCDVGEEETSEDNRKITTLDLAITPGLKRRILPFLANKHYVTVRSDGTVGVQTNSALALAFRPAKV